MKKWICSICKYVHKGDSAATECPVCGAKASKFTLMEPEPVEKPSSTNTATKPKQWKCVVCGYIHTGDEPPDECPVCGADKSQFILLESSEEEAGGSEPVGQKAPPSQTSAVSRLAARLKLLTKLHGHPITVHIPNGVLPLTVIFTFLAIALKSQPMAIAAKFNILFVALSMPAVLFSGVIDWHNRFAGKLSPVFRIKIICGGVVTLLTLIIGLWWIVSPDVYLSGGFEVTLFGLLNLADLVVAAVAGYYGGKLVFNNP